MDVLKPFLLFVSGLVIASIFFLFHLDHRLAGMLSGGREKGIALAIIPPSEQGGDGCPATYAIDNRTDHLVLLSLAGAVGPFTSAPDDSRWNSRPYGDDRGNRSRRSSYGSADMMGLGGDTTPDSSEPGVRSSDDAYPDDSNYGGSSSEYGDSGARSDGYGNARPDDYGGGSDGGYAPPSGGYQGSPSRDIFADNNGNIPPPPAGQPVPLTPGDNSSPYGAPPTQGYGNPTDPNWAGPPASRVRPGEIFFASTAPADGPDGPPQDCDPSVNTVTVQLSN
jgi:hypothetical protein